MNFVITQGSVFFNGESSKTVAIADHHPDPTLIVAPSRVKSDDGYTFWDHAYYASGGNAGHNQISVNATYSSQTLTINTSIEYSGSIDYRIMSSFYT